MKPCRRRNTYRLPGHDYSDSSYAYFVTLRTKIQTVKEDSPIDPQRPFTSCSALAAAVDASLHFYRRQGRWVVFAYCLMPNHLHLLASPQGGENLSNILGSHESYTTRVAWSHGVLGRLWQRSFHDRILRDVTAAPSVVAYILGNPVKAGLVDDWHDWPWCGTPDPL